MKSHLTVPRHSLFNATASKFTCGHKSVKSTIFNNQAAILQSIIDGIGDAVIVADMHGRFLVYNPAAVRMFGPAVQTEEGARPASLMLPDQKTLFPPEQLPLVRALRGE